MNIPTLSIITVTYRDPAGLRATVNSLTELRRKMANDVELIVVDGGTGEEFTRLIDDIGDNIRVLSEPDRGIYDAMNKGLSLSTGRFVWFLNGGDLCTVTDPVVFAESLNSTPGHLLFAAYSLDTGYGRINRKPRDANYIWHGLPTSHQAILYPGDLARAQAYDLSYRIVGDYEFTARLIKSGIPTAKLPIEIASFQLGGISQVHAKSVASEATRVQQSILGLKWNSLLRSRLRHILGRNIRKIQTRKWGRKISQ
jgi:putative colanic acid biosynthesis glycosyltransferase